MCVSPISILNPNYGKSGFGSLFKDTESRWIRIPCGYCAECIALKQMYMVQRVQMEALENHFFFCTLTYKDVPEVLTSSGYSIAYADVRDIQLMFMRLYNSGEFSGLRMVTVSEFGTKKGRPHFHCLLAVPRKCCPTYLDCISYEHRLYNAVFENWSRNVGSKRKPEYVPLCEYHEKWIGHKLYRNYDLHYVTPSLSENGISDVAWYVLKYMMKSSPREIRLQRALRLNLPEDEYENIWSIVRPRCLKSLHFGLAPSHEGRKYTPSLDIVKYLRGCVARTPRADGFPWYYAPDTGLHFPLSRFYRNRPEIFTMQDALDFFYNKTTPELAELKTGRECVKIIDDYEKKIGVAGSHESASYFTDL